MHIERKNLPSDVGEIFFSGRYWYAASSETRLNNRPVAVGCGKTRDAAIADMRKLLSDQKGGAA